MSAGPQPRHLWFLDRHSAVRKCRTARALACRAKFKFSDRFEYRCKDTGNKHGLRQVPNKSKPTDRLLLADGTFEPTRVEHLSLLSFPRYRSHLLKQPLKSCRHGNTFIYFLLEFICSSEPRPVHSNVPAAGFRDKQTEKGTPIFFVSEPAFPSRFAQGRGERRDAKVRASRTRAPKMVATALNSLRRIRCGGARGAAGRHASSRLIEA